MQYSVGPDGQLIGSRTDYDILPPLSDGRIDFTYTNPSPDFRPTVDGWTYTGSREGFAFKAVTDFVQENALMLIGATVLIIALSASKGGRSR